MSDHSDDEALARLRAADPAAGATSDAEGLRHAVALRVGGPEDQGERGGQGERGRQSEHEDELLAVRRRRQTRRTAWIAAAAVAALGFSTGGYLIGAARSDDGPLPAITLQGAAGGAAADQGGVAGTMAAGDTAEGAATADQRIGMYWQRALFTSSGLSTASGTAEAWGFDPASVYTAETAARLAAALGLSGDPVEQDGTWMVGTWDGGGPVLQIYADGTAGVSYYNPALDSYGCLVMYDQGEGSGENLDGSSSSSSSSSSASSSTDGSAGAADQVAPVPSCTADDAQAPADALDIAQRLLTALGVSLGDFEWSTDTSDPSVTQVTGSSVRGGQTTGAGWGVGVVSGGVYSLWGTLAPMYSLGQYDVVAETDAVERLMDPRFGSQGGVMPLAYGAESDVAVQPRDLAPVDEPTAATPTVPARLEPGSPIGWPVQRVTIMDARLGLAQYDQPDGSTVLLPAYELRDSDGQTWSVVAVADAQLDFATQ